MVHRPSLLAGLKVVDFGTGMPPALISKFLRESGADIIWAPPENDQVFSEIYPAYRIWRRAQKLDTAGGERDNSVESLVSEADICIIGGEDHPDIRDHIDVGFLSSLNPRLIILEITGYPPFATQHGRPAVDILVQAQSGMAYEHYSDRPILHAFKPTLYGAALHGLMGIFAALHEREDSGRGQIVSTSMLEGVTSFTHNFWAEADRPSHIFHNIPPIDPVPLIVKCADGKYLKLVLGNRGSKKTLYRVLGMDHDDIDPEDSGLARSFDPPSKFFGDVELIARYAIQCDSQELLEALSAEGMVAARVLPPGECWDDPQVQHSGLIQCDENGVRYVGNPVSISTSGGPSKARIGGRERPLSGLRVLDFGAFVAGPGASVVLADLGADVIKIEPLKGDPSRTFFPSFSSVNRGKRSIGLDLKRPEAREIVRRLCEHADVVSSNFRPGVAARLGIGGESLRQTWPALVVLETSGYGATGPMADQAAFDPVMQALCGHEMRAGGEGNSPLWNRAAMADFMTAYLGAVAVLMALYHRRRTGEGALADVSLLGGGIYLLSELIQSSNGEFLGGELLNRGQTGVHPAENMYAASDGWLAVAARGESMAERLIEVLGLRGEVMGPRAGWGADEQAAIAKAIEARRQAEVLAALEEARVWAEPCRFPSADAILNNSSFIRAGTVHEYPHPVFGNVRVPGPQFRLSRSVRGGMGPVAGLGEHTDEILNELGFDSDEIVALRNANAIA